MNFCAWLPGFSAVLVFLFSNGDIIRVHEECSMVESVWTIITFSFLSPLCPNTVIYTVEEDTSSLVQKYDRFPMFRLLFCQRYHTPYFIFLYISRPLCIICWSGWKRFRSREGKGWWAWKATCEHSLAPISIYIPRMKERWQKGEYKEGGVWYAITRQVKKSAVW